MSFSFLVQYNNNQPAPGGNKKDKTAHPYTVRRLQNSGCRDGLPWFHSCRWLWGTWHCFAQPSPSSLLTASSRGRPSMQEKAMTFLSRSSIIHLTTLPSTGKTFHASAAIYSRKLPPQSGNCMPSHIWTASIFLACCWRMIIFHLLQKKKEKGYASEALQEGTLFYLCIHLRNHASFPFFQQRHILSIDRLK